MLRTACAAVSQTCSFCCLFLGTRNAPHYSTTVKIALVLHIGVCCCVLDLVVSLLVLRDKQHTTLLHSRPSRMCCIWRIQCPGLGFLSLVLGDSRHTTLRSCTARVCCARMSATKAFDKLYQATHHSSLYYPSRICCNKSNRPIFHSPLPPSLPTQTTHHNTLPNIMHVLRMTVSIKSIDSIFTRICLTHCPHRQRTTTLYHTSCTCCA